MNAEVEELAEEIRTVQIIVPTGHQGEVRATLQPQVAHSMLDEERPMVARQI